MTKQERQMMPVTAGAQGIKVLLGGPPVWVVPAAPVGTGVPGVPRGSR